MPAAGWEGREAGLPSEERAASAAVSPRPGVTLKYEQPDFA